MDKIQKHQNNYMLQNEDAYFSGAHVRVFFGPIWVDDIITIQWDLVNNKAPIYGYASRFYDAIAEGTIIINGSFTIAFKDMGYLNTILENLKQLDPATRRGIAHTQDTMNHASAVNLALHELEGSRTNLSMKAPTVEMILAKMAANSDAHLGYMADRLENIIYGKIRGVPRIPRPDEYDKTGDVTRHGKIGSGFDILLEYGNPNTYSNEHTAYMINDVHITGFGQLTAPTGEPIAERYTFFAKSMNEGLPSRFIKPDAPISRPKVPDELESDDIIEEQLSDLIVREEAVPVPTAIEKEPEGTQITKILDFDTNIEPLEEPITSRTETVDVYVSPPINDDNRVIINVVCKSGWTFEGPVIASIINGPKDKFFTEGHIQDAQSRVISASPSKTNKRWEIHIDPTTPVNAYLIMQGRVIQTDRLDGTGRTTNNFKMQVSYGPKRRPKPRTRKQTYPYSPGGRTRTFNP